MSIQNSSTVEKTQTNGMIKHIALILGFTLAGVSIMCEVLFFLDFTETKTDKLIAVITAISLVGCQFMFLSAALEMKRLKNNTLSLFLLFVLLCLLVVSVSGTASFFESRFISQNNISLKSSDVYILNKQLITDLAEQNKALKSAAKAAIDKGNSWDAGRLLRSAQKSSDNRAEAINKLNMTKPTGSSAGESLAALTGSLRWGLWFVMAVLVDISALLCFAIVSSCKKSVSDVFTIQNNEEQTIQKRRTQSVSTCNIDEVIKTHICEGKYGRTPRVREIMSEYKKGHLFVKNIFDELIKEGALNKGENSRTFILANQA